MKAMLGQLTAVAEFIEIYLLQVLEISEVLFSPSSFLVLSQIFQIDEVYLNPFDFYNNSVRKTRLKVCP